MSLVVSVQTSLPWAQTWLDGSASSRSAKPTSVVSVASVDSVNSRIVPCTVAVISYSLQDSVVGSVRGSAPAWLVSPPASAPGLSAGLMQHQGAEPGAE